MYKAYIFIIVIIMSIWFLARFVFVTDKSTIKYDFVQKTFSLVPINNLSADVNALNNTCFLNIIPKSSYTIYYFMLKKNSSNEIIPYQIQTHNYSISLHELDANENQLAHIIFEWEVPYYKGKQIVDNYIYTFSELADINPPVKKLSIFIPKGSVYTIHCENEKDHVIY